jgi:uncharacterized membrane protein YcaP (DUF421 family)
MYTFALVAARFIGKRGMANLTPFEWIIVITIGTAAGDPTLYPTVPLIHGMVVITFVILLDRGLAIAMRKLPKLESIVNTDPTLVITEGRVLEDVLDKEHMSDEEFLMALRTQGLRTTSGIERAYLEPSGKVSVLFYEDGDGEKGRGRGGAPGSSTLPVKTERGRGKASQNATA